MKTILHLTFFISLFLMPNAANSQWIQTGGPLGTTKFIPLGENSSGWWAAASDGVFKSTNQGLTWVKIKTINNAVEMEVCGDTLFVIAFNYSFGMGITASLDYSFHRSYDNGLNWLAPVPLFTCSHTMPPILTKSNNRLLLYYDSEPSCAELESTDLGSTWTNNPLVGPTSTDIRNAEYTKNQLIHIENMLPFNSGNTLRAVSFNEGQTWAYADSSNNKNHYLANAIDSTFYFVSDTLQPKLTKCDINGNILNTSLVFPFPYTKFYKLIRDADSLFLGLKDTSQNTSNPYKVFKSIDKGTSWTALTANGSIPHLYREKYRKAISSNDYLYSGALLTKYEAANDTSYSMHNGINGTHITHLFSTGDHLYAADGNKDFRSDDNGETWIPINKQHPSTMAYGGNANLITYRTTDSIYVSTDKGLNWTSNAASAVPLYNLTGIYGNTIVYGYLFEIYVTTNFGATWNSYSLPGASNASDFEIVGTKDSVFGLILNQFADTLDKYYFDFNTNQFVIHSTLVNPSTIVQIALPNCVRVKDLWMYSSTNVGTIIYSNDGLNWAQANTSSLPQLASNPGGFSLPVEVNGVYYLAWGDSILVYSVDHGANWYEFTGGRYQFLNNLNFYGSQLHLTSHKGLLYANSYGFGVWRMNDTIQSFSGTIYYDINNNGTLDVSEPALANQLVYTTNSAAVSNASGSFTLLTDYIGDSLKVQAPVSGINSNPAYRITNMNQLTNNNFGLYGPSTISDFMVDITNQQVFNMGFNTYLDVNVVNNGTLSQSSSLTVTLDTALNYLSAIPAPNTVNGNTLTWILPSLTFTNNQTISIETKTKIGTLINTPIQCIASITPNTADINMSNNVDTLNELTVGSYDPNDKTCNIKESLPYQSYLTRPSFEYVIRFQNEGTFQTSFVKIADTLSQFFDLSTFKFLNSSHPCKYNFVGNALSIDFNPLALPPKAQDEAASQGFIKFSIKPKPNLPLGTTFLNTAYIYFDFNPAIITNTTHTTINITTNLFQHEHNVTLTRNEIAIYPNPASDYFIVDLSAINTDISQFQLNIYDLHGRLVDVNKLTNGKNFIPNKKKCSGLHLGNIVTSNGELVSSFKIQLNTP